MPTVDLLEPIHVTKTYLPATEEYNRYLQGIWERGWVTNNGPLVQELENELQSYLEVPHVQYVANGTIALQLAIRALSLVGEVITTPYSYVATTTAILWENCVPVFVDIDQDSLCIDADLIEANITENTSAILATHVYGSPCAVDEIAALAKRYDLKVIYDAAHAFGVKVKGKSIYRFGDVSTASFHATKIYHTIEGGAVITGNPKLSERVFLDKAFGHRADEYYQAGINGKNSEFHAAMGLCNLPLVDGIIEQRKELFGLYQDRLSDLPLRLLQVPEDVAFNYAYFPVIFDNAEVMHWVKQALENDQIYPRRYFYPSLNRLPYHQGQTCPVSEGVSEKVLCLPLYHQLERHDLERIVSIIRQAL